jgi:hypothetical protein
MEKCAFSESQFEAYHSRQLEFKLGSVMPQFFPSRNEEGSNGVDMVHFTGFYSLFFQYKISPQISSTHHKCRGLSGTCYRMKIYNRNEPGIKGQYELLWDWSDTEDHVYYAAPMFHTVEDFYRHYSNILFNTGHFKFKGGFKNPYDPGFNSHGHYLYYSTGSSVGLMYSDNPKEVQLSSIQALSEQVMSTKPKDLAFGTYLVQTKNRIAKMLRDRQLVKAGEKYRDELYDGEDSVDRNYFICNYFLQKYFGLNWTLLFSKNNL